MLDRDNIIIFFFAILIMFDVMREKSKSSIAACVIAPFKYEYNFSRASSTRETARK